MSKKEAVEIEQQLEQALDTGDDVALDKALRELAGGDVVSDDGTDGGDDDAGAGDATAGAGGTGTDDGAATGTDGEGAGTAGNDGTDDAATKAAAEAEAKAKATAGQGSQPGEEVEAPISNKAGTGTIPYQVLKDTRRHAAILEDQLRKSEEEKAELRQKLEAQAKAAGADQATASAAADAAMSGDTDPLAELLAEGDENPFPEPIVKAIRTLNAQNLELRQKLEAVQTTAQSVAAQSEASRQETTQSVIDQVPDLVEWQGSRGVLWRRALELDKEFLATGKWDDKDPKERFEAIAAKVREEVGLPPRAPSNNGNNSAGNGTKAQQRNAGAAVPSSISEIPGGGAPAVDINDTIERTSAPGLAARMESMNDGDIDVLLSKLS